MGGVGEEKKTKWKSVTGGWQTSNQTFSVSDSVTHQTLSFQSVTVVATRLLQSVTSALQSSFGHLVPLPAGGGRKESNNQRPGLAKFVLVFFFFFFYLRFTAWAKIINIWPTGQLIVAEKFCLHLTQLGLKQRGGTLETQKFILERRGAGEQHWCLVFRMIDHFKKHNESSSS